MQLQEAIKIALSSLWANKLRSVLTLIGVVIGVASVIAVVTLVNGANHYVATKVYGYGADVFTATKTPGVIFDAEEFLKYNKRRNIKMADYEAVAAECTLCTQTGAAQETTGNIVYGKESSKGSAIRGWTWTMPPIANTNIDTGRGWTAAEEQHATHVAIIGYDIIDNLMPGEDPLGKEIRVDGEDYTVIGTGERQGKTLGQSQDNWVAIPITAYQHSHGSNQSVDIYASAGATGDRLDRAADQVRTILRSRRHDLPGADDDFAIDTNATFVGIWESISSSFAMVAVFIAAISLVVGGIVIMNIMLVSVTERTREIGVRKALGARRGDILSQFLIESATMSLVGGIIGVVLGVGVAKIFTLIIGWEADVAIWSVLAGLAVATGVGIFFGVYPAQKAAKLDPITALRSEL
jgi:putative ABC transport system permease protein